MAKKVTKELIIVLLVILATILIVGVILYDFMPNNKIVPEEITYTTSQEVKDKLKATEGFSAEEVLMTYSLDQSDLDNYQITNDYRPGKTNPFSTYVTQSVDKSNTTSNDNTSGGSSTGGNAGNSSSGNTGSKKPIQPGEVNSGNYTNDKGLK